METTFTTSRLYRQAFTPAECALLEEIPALSAVTELAALRLLLSRVVTSCPRPAARKSGRPPGAGVGRAYAMLVTLAHVGFTMASLARFQFRRDGPPPDPILLALAAMDDEDL
jgi:hypothetical protein